MRGVFPFPAVAAALIVLGTISLGEPGFAQEGTAGRPPAAGPPDPPRLSGEQPAGRTTPGILQPPAEFGRGDRVEYEQQTPATGDRTAPAVADEPGRQRTPPAAASPGRRESPPPAAPVTPSGREPLSERQKMVERTLQCRMDKVARMLELAVEGPESSASMGLEREVLVLCRDRGKVVREMIDAELKLAAILRSDRQAREQAALDMEARRQEARARIEGARQGAADAAREVEERRLVEQNAKAAAAARAEEAKREARAQEEDPDKKEEPAPVVVVAAPQPKTHELFGWYTIIGSGDDLRAGVTDGAGRWMVEVGDELPDGARVTQISARPPRVRTAGGPPSGLPYRGAR